MDQGIARGFPLIEAMVIFAVVGSIAAIGILSYWRYAMRTTLGEAGTALAEYRTRMEHFYQDHRTYAKGGACGPTVPTNVENFIVQCAIGAGGQRFTATATGAGSAAGIVYMIDQANVRSTLAIPAHWGHLPADAFSRWVTR
jgi:type IV pilus assembly protein PilE